MKMRQSIRKKNDYQKKYLNLLITNHTNTANH